MGFGWLNYNLDRYTKLTIKFSVIFIGSVNVYENISIKSVVWTYFNLQNPLISDGTLSKGAKIP